MPLISMIMPVKNGADTIAAAVDSFCAQDWPDKELVVVDGLSDDATPDILARYAASSAVRVLRGADASATEAVNRGAEAARGAVIGLLMADDWLGEGALRRIAQAFAADPSLDIVSGAAEVVDETGSGGRAAPSRALVPASALGLTPQSILGVPYPAAFFFAAGAWRALGGFRERYRYAADRDLLMRAMLTRRRAQRIEAAVYVYRKHAGSATLADNDAVIAAFLQDHLSMAQSWLAEFAPTPKEARAIARWRRVQAFELAARKFRGGARRAALAQLAHDAAADPRLAITTAARLAQIAHDKWRAGRAITPPVRSDRSA